MTRWHVRGTVKERWWDAPREEMEKARLSMFERLKADIDSGFVKEYGNTIDNVTHMIVEGTETQVYDWVRKLPGGLQYLSFEVTPLIPFEKQWARFLKK